MRLTLALLLAALLLTPSLVFTSSTDDPIIEEESEDRSTSASSSSPPPPPPDSEPDSQSIYENLSPEMKQKMEACSKLLQANILQIEAEIEKLVTEYAENDPLTTQKIQAGNYLLLRDCIARIQEEAAMVLVSAQDVMEINVQDYKETLTVASGFYEIILKIKFTPEELNDLKVVEKKILAAIKREQRKEEQQRQERLKVQGGPQTGVFWIDLTTLSPQTKLLYSIFVIGLFGLVIFLMFRKVLYQPEDPSKLRRQQLLARKEKRKSKGD